MIIPENNKNQMKSTRLHLAKGIKLIQRLLKGASLFFCFADASIVFCFSQRAKVVLSALTPSHADCVLRAPALCVSFEEASFFAIAQAQSGVLLA